MAMTVQRKKETKLPHVFQHKVADIRGGVSVAISDLGGDYLYEGTPISTPVNGVCHVVKYAVLTSDITNSATTINVKKGHQFKVGDFVAGAKGAKAYAITAIDKTTNKNYDTITVGTTLALAIAAGGFIFEAAAESSSTTSALKYKPLALVGTGKPVIAGQNVDTDAWVVGVTKGNELPTDVADALKGIINY